ncbi:hypothetical protein FA95DRAFT_17666 [Auriscalpium vulgare]|uniref:Uncharacterized protein n=1 Tax=Auriscalpium vulgare TaxID=40419 RepID=A0ACB8SBQ5_9AGAM|nr:hypothetical protein FA95DRAFT_17666 [Auriscalpium vulgare]
MLALLAQCRRQCLPLLSFALFQSTQLRSRSFHGVSLHPSIQGFASSLAQTQPCFSVSSSRVRVLYEPRAFYDTLLSMIRGARKRIFISSLYIGSGETELVHALHDALRLTPSLHVYLQLDLNRSTRPGSASTTTLLAPLLVDFPTRTHVSLFRSPKLKGLMARLVPPRFNEGWGTWHAKIYGADDDIMISGANLNKSYFTDRQDRYLQFTKAPDFADYCFSFLQTAASFSYQLLPPAPSEAPDTSAQSQLHWPHPSHPHHIERQAGLALTQLQQSYVEQNQNTIACGRGQGDDDTFIFPVIQAGQFGVREEERCLGLLFDTLSQDMHTGGSSGKSPLPLVDLTSGYFGLHGPYQEMLLQSPANVRIICASPEANGFLGSRGISGRIPEGYTYLEKRFMSAVQAAGRGWIESNSQQPSGAGIQLFEWRREGWTYHSKGIWLSPSPSSAPILTLFGSTNLNSRSSSLDAELSFVLLTSSPALQSQLKQEVDGLQAHAGPWRGDERPVRVGTKVLVGVVGGML